MKKRSIVLLLTFSLLSSTVVYAGDSKIEKNELIKQERVQVDGSQGNAQYDVGNKSGDSLPQLYDVSTLQPESEESTEQGQDSEQQEGENQNQTGETQKPDEEKPVEKHYGWYQKNSKSPWYYYDSKGNMYCGWLKYKNKWYYMDKNNEENPGAMLRNCKTKIGTATYFFNKNGVMLTGWVKRPEGWYYTNKSGAMLTGWQKISGKWYYLDGSSLENLGLMHENCKSIISKKTYFFNKSGAMLTGWVKRSEGWYYDNKSGAMLTGWQKVRGKWYYLDKSNKENPGLMLASVTKKIGEKTYSFLSSGAMKSGWVWENKGWYYYDSYSGQMASGWEKISGKWYYLNPDNGNKMLSSTWSEIKGKWYHFASNGAMHTNWTKIGRRWYYFGSDGAARTGWQAIGAEWYYFYKVNDKYGGVECAMAANVKIDGWQLTSSGAMVSTAATKMTSKAQIYKSSSKYLILVDRNACRVGIFKGKAGDWKQEKYWKCSPGKPSTPTVSGVFKVGSKGRYFDSGSARCHWYTQFKGNYLFHSVLYTKSGKISDGRLGMKLSHGCVRLDIKNAKWIYDNIPRGTTVVVY